MIPLVVRAEVMLLEELVEEELNDDSPSDAVAHAHFNPLLGIVEIEFAKSPGQIYRFPCNLIQWIEYKGASSKGSAIYNIFGVRGGQ